MVSNCIDEPQRHGTSRGAARLQRLEAFDPQKMQKRVGVPGVLELEGTIDKALSSAFGYGTAPYLRYNLAVRTTVRPVGGPKRRDAQAQEARQYFSQGKERSIALLREAIRALDGEISDAQPVAQAVQKSKTTQKAGEVLVLSRTAGTSNELLPGDDKSEAVNSASVPKSGLGGVSFELKAAWRRVGRWWRGRN
jgi:hypothetical protein